MRNFKAFTLIELLVVVSIIVILMGLTASGVMMAVKKAKTQKARTEVLNLLTAVKMFRSEIGIYPSNITQNTLGKSISMSEATTGIDSGDDKIFGPYMEFKTSNTDAAGNLRDPWGEAYEYREPGDDTGLTAGSDEAEAVDNGFAIVYSKGSDTNYNTDDDIGSWQ